MTVSEILGEVKARTGRTEYTAATITPLIRAILRDITVERPFLRTSTSIVVSGRETVLESAVNEAIFLVDGKGNTLKKEARMESIPHDDRKGEPKKWFAFGRSLYVYPEPDKSYTFTMWYSYVHPASLAAIELPDQFMECVILGTVMKVFEAKQLWTDARSYLPLYTFEKRKLASVLIEKEARFVEYNDF